MNATTATAFLPLKYTVEIHSHSLQSPYNNNNNNRKKPNKLRVSIESDAVSKVQKFQKATPVMKTISSSISPSKSWERFFCAMCTFFFFLRHRECNHNYSLQPEVSS